MIKSDFVKAHYVRFNLSVNILEESVKTYLYFDLFVGKSFQMRINNRSEVQSSIFIL